MGELFGSILCVINILSGDVLHRHAGPYIEGEAQRGGGGGGGDVSISIFQKHNKVYVKYRRYEGAKTHQKPKATININ